MNKVQESNIKGTEQNPLEISELSQELKDKITRKFHELAGKHPHMKRDRLMRKAGEFYKVKFTFE